MNKKDYFMLLFDKANTNIYYQVKNIDKQNTQDL